MRLISIFIILFLNCVVAFSQQRTPKIQQADSLRLFFSEIDTVNLRNENGTLQFEHYYNQEALQGMTFRDTLFYNPLYLPVIFNGKMLPLGLNLYNPDKAEFGQIINPEETFAPKINRAKFIQSVRNNYYLNYPDRVKYSVIDFASNPPPIKGEDILDGFDPFKDPISSETSFSLDIPSIEGAEIKRKYWVVSGTHSLQFSQNYFSDNWHKGGISNMNINSLQKINLNYQKNKVRFNNSLEWQLSVFNAPDDSLRKYSIGQDLIRYFGDFGIDAFIKRWSYSANLEARTQFFNSCKPNTTEVLSAFFAPLYVNAGIGLKYELDKKSEKVRHRRTRMKLHLSPVSVNFKYVGNDKVDVARFGIEENKKTSISLGSAIINELTYDFNRYTTWTSRLKCFTNYTNIEAEFENTLDMALTNAFSTRIYLHLRYDDSVPEDPRFKYLQVNEMLSFGLNYKW